MGGCNSEVKRCSLCHSILIKKLLGFLCVSLAFFCEIPKSGKRMIVCLCKAERLLGHFVFLCCCFDSNSAR